ncbi:SAP domain containing protein [Aphelenchoides avenae]|nr:SAP domain containing protein [Aphelenchus avenae]
MSSKEELEKLTVNQLKEKLKGRKLPSSGTKSELVIRLHESIVAEEKLLEATGSGMDLNDVDVDEVLGFDERKSDGIPERQEEAPKDPKPSETISASANASTNGATSDVCNILVKKQLVASFQATKPVEEPKDDKSEKKDQSGTEEQKDAGNSTTGSTKSGSEAGDSDGDKTKSEKKTMLKTAARLGLPIADADAKKNQRAARFGTAITEEAKAKRAERFGLSSSTDAVGASAKEEKLAERAKRFGIPVKRSSSPTTKDPKDPEVLEKRAKRFLDNDPDAEKKKARAERFGIA